MSARQKHEREAVRAVERIDPAIKCLVRIRRGCNSHKLLVVQMHGQEVYTHSLSSSPTSPDVMVERVQRECRRALQQKGIIA